MIGAGRGLASWKRAWNPNPGVREKRTVRLIKRGGIEASKVRLLSFSFTEMPFERYLTAEIREKEEEEVAFSEHVNFQIPHLAYAGPTVAPGGGAEVLPSGVSPQFATCVSSDSQLPLTNIPPSSSSPWNLNMFHPSGPFTSSNPPLLYLPRPVPTANYYPSSPAVTYAVPLPSLQGLPLYSSTGFDLLSILSRVASRPHPKIVLGPVDMSCAFTVVDTSHYDSPIGMSYTADISLSHPPANNSLRSLCLTFLLPAYRLRRPPGRWQKLSLSAIPFRYP